MSTILLLGATGSMGRRIARQVSRRGLSLVLAGRELDQLVQLAESLSPAADPLLAAEARDGAMVYFTKRLAQVQYAAFQAASYPIGSGSTESANKLVVEARLKGSGMHWARAQVKPLVALRTVACSDRWAAAWPSISTRLRAEAEQRRRARWRARHPTPTPTSVEVASPLAAVTAGQPSPTTTPPARRAKSIVNGRPSALHPWKRYGYAHPSHDARDLRFPG